MKIPTLKKYLKTLPRPKLKYKYVLTEEQQMQVRELRLEGLKIEWLALEYGVSLTAIRRVIKDLPQSK